MNNFVQKHQPCPRPPKIFDVHANFVEHEFVTSKWMHHLAQEHLLDSSPPKLLDNLVKYI
jgi:hypothetical protein